MNKKFKKIQTIYRLTENVQLIQNDEFDNHICLIEYGEPCSGILKHWGSVNELIKELRNIADKLEKWSSY